MLEFVLLQKFRYGESLFKGPDVGFSLKSEVLKKVQFSLNVLYSIPICPSFSFLNVKTLRLYIRGHPIKIYVKEEK